MSQDRVQRSRLLGRRGECEALDRVLTDALAGQSRVIVVRRATRASARARHCVTYTEQIAGWHVAAGRWRRVGGWSWPTAACISSADRCWDHLGRLPGSVPQREALATVFGQSSGSAPDRFLVGLRHPDAVRRGRRANNRSSASSTTRNGSTRPPPRSSVSSPAAPRGAGRDGVRGAPGPSMMGFLPGPRVVPSRTRRQRCAGIAAGLTCTGRAMRPSSSSIVVESHGNPLALARATAHLKQAH